MRRDTDAVTMTVLNWKLKAKRPRGRTRKRCMNVVDKDLDDIRTEGNIILEGNSTGSRQVE